MKSDKDFFNYIHAVGTGPKSNRDLTFDESKDMMMQILNRSVCNEQIAAFLLGWRLKPETIEEFSGAVSAFDDYIRKTKIENSIELGYPFDGKVKNPYIFPLVAKVLSKSDLNLVVVGDDRQPAKGGITIKEIVTQINLEKNIHYFDRADFFKELHDLTQLRMNLGLRNGFNTIEKLTHVASSRYAITGVFHRPYVKKYVEIFSSKYDRLALVQGNEGTPEIFGKCRMWVAEGKEDLKEYIIDPKRYGIEYQKSTTAITIDDSIKQLQNPSDEYIKLATLNAAIYLFVANKAKTIDEAYEVING